MSNDSLETLLLRHYGPTAPTPPDLEQQLVASTQQQAASMQQSQSFARRLETQKLSRRQVMRLVAFGSAGLGVISIGLESLHSLEESLLGQDRSRPAYP
jgi:hypothetical protein